MGTPTIDNWAAPLKAIAKAAFDEIGRKRLVDIKLRLTEAHYKDALELLGETRDEVVLLRAELETLKTAKLMDLVQNGGAA